MPLILAVIIIVIIVTGATYKSGANHIELPKCPESLLRQRPSAVHELAVTGSPVIIFQFTKFFFASPFRPPLLPQCYVLTALHLHCLANGSCLQSYHCHHLPLSLLLSCNSRSTSMLGPSRSLTRRFSGAIRPFIFLSSRLQLRSSSQSSPRLSALTNMPPAVWTS
jgi:hypothetical protein